MCGSKVKWTTKITKKRNNLRNLRKLQYLEKEVMSESSAAGVTSAGRPRIDKLGRWGITD